MKGGSSSSSSRKRSEQPPPTEEEDDNKMYEVEEDEEDQAEDEEEEENNPQEEEEEEEEEQRPKLAEGFFEIEAVRGKRTRKGKRQYLIKWRGWPETANTWEPFDNLQSCSDIIQAFEQRSAKTSRKRKRKHTTTTTPPTSTSQTQPPKKKQQQQQPDHNTNPVETPDTTHYPPLQQADDAATLYHLTHNSFTDFHIPLEQTNQPDPLFSKLTGPLPPPPTLLDNANISVQVPHTAPDQSKPETSARFIGAKRRKSGRVRRFKQDSLPPALHDTRPSIPQITNAPMSLLLEPFANDARDVDCFENPSAIIKIIKPIGYSTSLSNDVHDVSLIFRAIRSDGGETEVDNNYLKVHNPLLLISYYEQHLRYTPPPYMN